MAPGRRRGAKGLKKTNELSLGDLVLAKVKGFPAWPAKISRPEDWERAPDPKKYFVQFYGTSEIAFVAPVDIQEFTVEAKNKLVARCKGKTVKYFAQAVEEICEEFEKLQKKKSNCLEDETSEQGVGSEEPSADLVVDDDTEVDLKDRNDSNGHHQEMRSKDLVVDSTLEPCSQKQEAKSSEDVKSCMLGEKKAIKSPETYVKRRNKLKTDGSSALKELASPSSSCNHHLVQEGASAKKVKDDITLGEQSRKMTNTETCNKGGGSSPSVASDPAKNANFEQKESTNGRKPKVVTGSKKKSEGEPDKHNAVGSVALPSSARDNSARGVKPFVSGRQAGDGIRNKIASDVRKLSSPDMGDCSGTKAKKLRKEKHYAEAMDEQRGAKANFEEQDKAELSRKKKNIQHGREKLTSQKTEVSPPPKRSKCSEMADASAKLSLQTDRKGNEDVKRSSKMENRSASGVQVSNADSSYSGDDDVLPPTKRRRWAVEAVGSSASTPEKQMRKTTVASKNDVSASDSRRSSVTLPTKRRAVRIFEDDDEEAPKTPVHGGSANKVLADTQVLNPSKKTDAPKGASAPGEITMKKTGMLENGSTKELASSIEQPVDGTLPGSQQDVEKKLRKTRDTLVRSSPGSVVLEKVSLKEDKTTIQSSPLKSPQSVASCKAMPETQKPNKDTTKLPNTTSEKKAQVGQDNTKLPSTTSEKKAQVGQDKGIGATDGSNASLVQSANGKNKQSSLTEKKKATPKSNSQVEDDSVTQLGSMMGANPVPGERLEAERSDKINSLVDMKTSDSGMSMRHLIAAAQAKRRQAHLQNSHVNPLSFMVPLIEVTRGSHSPSSPVQPLGSSSILRQDLQGFQSHSSLASPSSDIRQPSTTFQHESEHHEEKKNSSGNWAAAGSLSGDTEAAVARDAFEGMIETLSRTKESIGRATRLAIDCAKYGIANEVIELLIRKLENEPSFHRRVDLFFLVDSITQCSHSHKGIAGASYIPTVQAALPRLLGAAAPPGPVARENRRQCLKVLGLWLERKILPESLLRPHMDEIGVATEDTSSGLSFRRPFRAERAIDDPIREMEGMLVDEYGSNATFQLPGFFTPHAFQDDDEEEEEEEDNPSSTSKEVEERSPAEHTPASRDPENHIATPSERRHCILEDVDGELEMEDVSGHLKDEKQSYVEDTFEIAYSYPSSERMQESASNDTMELPPLPEGSPPLPPDSPPQTPPLPSSPAPTSLPPPPPSSPSPPPPPPPPTRTHSFPLLPVGPPPALVPHLPLQKPQPPSIGSQCLHPLAPSIPPPSPVVFQQTPLPHEIGMPSAKQPSQMAANAPHGPHSDIASRNDMYSQKSPCLLPAGVGGSRETSGYTSSKPLEYGQNDAYVNAQAPQPNQQFQVVNAPYAQRPLHPNALAPNPADHFSYAKPPVQQHPPHPQHPYPPPYSLPNLPEAPRRYVADEQWRPRPADFNSDHHQSSWMGAGRSYSGPPPFSQEGYFRPPPERPPINTFGFQPSTTGVTPPGALGHGISGRPDMPSLSWRPV